MRPRRNGQLGTGDIGGSARSSATRCRSASSCLQTSAASQIACGSLHSVVLRRVASYHLWMGRSRWLGHGSFNYELQAKQVEELGLRRVTCIGAGAKFTVALEGDASSGLLALSRDLGALLHEAQNSDCVLCAGRGSGERRFLAHMAVLSCRCPRLMAMFAFSSDNSSASTAGLGSTASALAITSPGGWVSASWPPHPFVDATLLLADKSGRQYLRSFSPALYRPA